MLSCYPFDISVGIRAFVIALCQISSFFLLIHSCANLTKNINTCAGPMLNFIPTKFRKNSASDSVVKANYAIPNIYMH